MNFQEILNKLDEAEVDKNSFIHGEVDFNELGLGETKEVDSYGGEGQGETYYTVVYFVDHDVYIKLSGFYTSYDGVSTDGYEYEEVKPIQKTITIYE